MQIIKAKTKNGIKHLTLKIFFAKGYDNKGFNYCDHTRTEW